MYAMSCGALSCYQFQSGSGAPHEFLLLEQDVMLFMVDVRATDNAFLVFVFQKASSAASTPGHLLLRVPLEDAMA